MLAGATSAGAQAQTPATAPPAPADATRPATTTFLGDTGLWFVPTAEVLPRKRLLGQRLLLQHRSRGRLHRRRPLHRHLRLRRRRSHRAVPVDARRLAHRSRLPPARLRRQPRRRSGQRISADARRLVGHDVRRHLRRRQVQPPLRVRAGAGRPRRARRRQAADRQRRLRRAPRPASPTSSPTSSSARKSTRRSSCPATAASWCAASRISTATAGGPTRSRTACAGASASRFPTRSPLRLTAELYGERYFDDTLTGRALVGGDALSPYVWPNRSPVEFTLGGTWISPNGFFAGVGATVNFAPRRPRQLRLRPRGRGRRQHGHAVPHRLSPGRADVYVPPPPRAADAAADDADQPAADGQGALRALHRRSGQGVDGHRRRQRSGRRYARPIAGPRRPARWPTRPIGRRGGPRPCRKARCR